MARIRTIKPELLEDEKVASLPHLAWRVFVSCLLLADDYGNFRAAPARVHGAALWAHPREGLAKALECLAVGDLLVFYAIAGQLYGHIIGWDKHQKVDHPGKPLCPGLTDGSRIPRETLANVLDPLASDRDQDPDPGSGPTTNPPPPVSEPPDQTRSNVGAESRVTGFELRRVFGIVRSEQVGGLSWNVPSIAGGKDSAMAEVVNADLGSRVDVKPTMELLFALAKDGKAGDRSALILTDGSFAFSAWCSQWTSLRERLHGVTPLVPPGIDRSDPRRAPVLPTKADMRR